MNPTRKAHVIQLHKPLPDNEDERTAEARELVSTLAEEDYPKLTTWERQTILDVQEGKAATKIRLLEIRKAIKRIHGENP